MSEKAFQDLIGPENHCHGCGPFNEKGLRIKSFWQDDSGVCRWTPEAHHCAGSTEVLNGGIISSVIDCHSVNLAMADAYKQENREIGSEPKIWYVTGRLEVDFLKPTPVASEVTLNAKVIRREGRKTWIECELKSGELVCAQAEVLAVRLKDSDT